MISNKINKLFLLFNLLMGIFIRSQVISENVKINVDISKLEKVSSLSGFLHYKNIRELDNSIKELQPKYWRIGSFSYSIEDVPYLIDNGITPVVVISDLYGYPGRKNNKEWPHPLQSEKLDNLIINLYKKLGNSVIYDIWNEPFHQDGFGDFDKEEFYKIFKKAHDLIRMQPGGDKAIITGPSFDRYKQDEIESFLQFCNDNSIIVNILNWHEWRSGASLSSLKKDLDYVRNRLLPKYPRVKVKKIMFFEIINQYIQFSPSEILYTFKVFEDNGIDGAVKGCWPESDGIYNCDKNNLDGLLDNEGNPRSAWWGYKYYAQSITNRVKSTSNKDEVVSFGSINGKKINLLVANNSHRDLSNTLIAIEGVSSLFKLQNFKYVTVKIYEIKDSGEKLQKKLPLILTKKIKITNRKINLKIPKINKKVTYYIEFEV